MLKFNSGKIDRQEAIDRVRLIKPNVDFLRNNPTVRDPKLQQFADVYDQLIDEHQITPAEIEGESTELATNDNDEADRRLVRSMGSLDPVSVYYQNNPKAKKEYKVLKANKMDRDHDIALPYKPLYKPSVDKFDTEQQQQVWDQRKEEFNPDDHADFNPELMGQLREAYAIGMDAEHAKKALNTGVPFDYLLDTFVRSARPHTIQLPEARALGNVRGIDFKDTIAGQAARDYTESQEMPESQETGIANENWVPIRMSVMHPLDIADAHAAGATSNEVLSAWHNNGYHPLASYGSEFTEPISKYISVRDMGVNHDEAKALISSPKRIEDSDFKIELEKGKKPSEIVNVYNGYEPDAIEGPGSLALEQ
jgi:hypothetical protein